MGCVFLIDCRKSDFSRLLKNAQIQGFRLDLRLRIVVCGFENFEIEIR